jgi:hypothetical protein
MIMKKELLVKIFDIAVNCVVKVRSALIPVRSRTHRTSSIEMAILSGSIRRVK